MGLDFVNRHVAKILLAVRDGDSINKVSTKTGSSYSYTYEWVNRLEEIGVFERDDGIQVLATTGTDAPTFLRTGGDPHSETPSGDHYQHSNSSPRKHRFVK